METSVKEVSGSLYRLLLCPTNAKLDDELFYEDDAGRFSDRGLDIQDFAPSYIDVYSYVTRREGEENRDTAEIRRQVFVYSFSYMPDPTWLVNWENGTNIEDWFDADMIRLSERTKTFELDLGEYISGLTAELETKGGDSRVRILDFVTNRRRDFTVSKTAKTNQPYRLELPDGFGIIGRFPAPMHSFGFYVGWMMPKTWTVRTHAWFPEDFRIRTRTLLLVFHRISKTRADKPSTEGYTNAIPGTVLKDIVLRLSRYETSLPSDQMKSTEWQFIKGPM